MPKNTTTTDNAPVKAQDFWDAFHSQVSKLTEHYLVKSGYDVVENITSQFENLLSRARQQAFSEGRKQGLKEMDEAHETMAYAWDTKNRKEYKAESDFIDRLRKEYSTTK